MRRFEKIAVEDLAVANMVKNRCLPKAISRSGWRQFRAPLTDKAQRCGATLVVVDRFYPSPMTCSACGHLLPSLSLRTPHWTCPGCGARHERDINAAKNILAVGAAVARKAMPGQETSEGTG